MVDKLRRTLALGLPAVGLGAVIAGGWQGAVLRADAQRVRHDVRSDQGQAMLEIYAKAVKRMASTSAFEPSSWTFQWYTHWVRRDRGKAAEIQRVFAGMAPDDPRRLLANLMWSTCQAHGSDGSMWRPNFLPWHRAYILYFERIIRKVSGADEFTLPYWDYVDDATLPEQFRVPGSAKWKALYVGDRNDHVNAGRRIDDGFPTGILNHDALSERTYTRAATQGFNAKLDGELHGRIHVFVGKTTNMGDVPFAAKDPIFWLHHCNIDRIWSTWNRIGGKNPTTDRWTSDQKHIFANEDGVSSPVTNGMMSDISAVGYEYDRYPSAAPLPPVPVAVAQAKTLAQTGGGISLKVGPTQVELTAVPGVPSPASAAATAEDRSKNIYLVIKNLSTNLQPGTLYGVYVGTPREGGGEPPSTSLVGHFQFFDTANKEHEFLISKSQVEKAATASRPDRLNYYIVPAGKPESDARPQIGSVELVEK